MRQVLWSAVLAGSVFSIPAIAGNYNVTTFTVPGYGSAEAEGINDSGTIVGNAISPTGFRQPFTITGGSASLFSVPNYAGTGAAPNATGNVIANDGTVGGFQYDYTGNYGYVGTPGGSFTEFSSTGSTTFSGITNSSGPILGATVVHGLDGHGGADGAQYINNYNGSGVNVAFGFTTTLTGGALNLALYEYATGDNTVFEQSNSAGVIAGYAKPTAGGNDIGFTFASGMFTTLTTPAGYDSLVANSINDSGEIVGFVIDPSGGQHGYIDNGGVPAIFDVAGAVNTYLYGVNDAGDIVGAWVDANGNRHPFEATPASAVPEPGSLSVIGAGLLGLLSVTRRRAR